MATETKKISIRLNAFLFDIKADNFQSFLESAGRGVKSYDLQPSLGITGKIYIKERDDGRPRWAEQLDLMHGTFLNGLTTRSASAVLFVRAGARTVAFTFGYGRYLLDDAQFVLDFGIKTALNILDNTTLRSVDLFSLEQEPMQKRTQAIRNSNINSFGIDVSRDILKAVTGQAMAGIEWETIHGAGPQFSFTAKLESFSDLAKIAIQLGKSYDLSLYKNNFGWVDNIQRIQNTAFCSVLDNLLVTELQNGIPSSLQLTLPEIGEWDKIAGFSFTNSKAEVKPMLSANDYFMANPAAGHTLKKLKSNKVFCLDVNDNKTHYSVYGCLYYECIYKSKVYILFSNAWFSIDQDFLNSINLSLDVIAISKLNFPDVQVYQEHTSFASSAKIKAPLEVESEGAYNERISKSDGYHLLDKKLVKPRTGASSVELCDLLSNKREFIHAKHRKGGSAGISHLFAQGRISAELLLSDQEFRKEARTKLKGSSKDLIGPGKFDPSLCEIVFLVLGDDSIDVKKNLPFFSKVNLWITYLSLTQRNFKVSIAGAALSLHPISRVSIIPIVTKVMSGKTGSIKIPASPVAKPKPFIVASTKLAAANPTSKAP